MSADLGYTPMAAPSEARGLALFEEVVAEIEAHQLKTWDQSVWIDRNEDDHDRGVRFGLATLHPAVRETLIPAFDCGTVACIYGHAVFKAGARMYVDDEGDLSDVYVTRPDDGEAVFIQSYAEHLFGLPGDLSEYIRHASRTWEEILAFRDAWRADASEGPDVDSHRYAIWREEYESPW